MSPLSAIGLGSCVPSETLRLVDPEAFHVAGQLLDNGVPPEKLVLGVHTEGKAWVLEANATDDNCPGPECPAGIYCPAESGAPNMTYSRQVGWMFYYEVLQFFYKLIDGSLIAGMMKEMQD